MFNFIAYQIGRIGNIIRKKSHGFPELNLLSGSSYLDAAKAITLNNLKIENHHTIKSIKSVSLYINEIGDEQIEIEELENLKLGDI